MTRTPRTYIMYTMTNLRKPLTTLTLAAALGFGAFHAAGAEPTVRLIAGREGFAPRWELVTPTVAVAGWTPGPGNDVGQGYGVWVHDDSPDAPCNEWNVEPVAEVDGHGNLCPSTLP